ncbi:MAG: radical SAM protein, partial [Planctomycetia bacterium]|nr:radical SAM protein [Planctomycetia bacterium]
HAKIRWATEATIHDTLRMKDILPLLQKAGLQELWLGVEDMSGALVRKGQSMDKTVEAFRILRENGILPIPMMMHHDSQPLYTRKDHSGLLNQIRLLRKAGAAHVQVLMLTPAVGSKSYVDAFTSGLAYESVDSVPVEPHIVDGNYVVASRSRTPWCKQLNLLAAYLYFFNPLHLLVALLRPKTRILKARSQVRREGQRPSRRHRTLGRRIASRMPAYLADAVIQILGMFGLFVTARRTLPWALHLMRGKIKRTTKPPTSKIPMRSVNGGPACHALPGTPTPPAATLEPKKKAAVASRRP